MQPFRKSFGTLLITSLLGESRRREPKVTRCSGPASPRNLQASVLEVSERSVVVLLKNRGREEAQCVRLEYRAGATVLVHHEACLGPYHEVVVELKLPQAGSASLQPEIWMGQAS